MTKCLKFYCNLCCKEASLGYGVDWPDGKLRLSNDAFDTKNRDVHLCLDCFNQLEKFASDEKFNRSVSFRELTL